MMPVRCVAILATLIAYQSAFGQPVPSCRDDPVYGVLDFWLGEWDVVIGGRRIGTNRIEPVLGGCAILEHWHSALGVEGKSWFYYQPALQQWKQVWVSERAGTRGGVKEKHLVERLDDGTVRFQGEIHDSVGIRYLDRTTLIPRQDGSVRQIIEESTDGGENWSTTFDAVYRRR